MSLPDKLIAKFHRLVQKGADDACWPWTGRKNERGYGRPTCDAISYRAHRIAWELAHGSPVPDNRIIRHTCDNPSCCNPRHLLLGTPADNMRDAVKRERVALGSRREDAKLSEDAVLIIRNTTAPVSALARAFGVDRKTIRQARDATRWKHVQ
jgi:hypothetical protein